jgi:histidinol-phosphate aminotransferase
MVRFVDRKRLKFKKDYLYLNRNTIMDQHPSFIHESLLECFSPDHLHQYPDLWETYEKLSAYLGVPEEQLLITRGVEGGIRQVFDNLVIEGKNIGVTLPGYAMYEVYAKCRNANVVAVRGAYPDCKITVDQIKEIVPQIHVLFLDNPKSHMPSCFDHDELNEIIKYCENHGVIVFLDEVYVGWEVESYLPNLCNHENLIISRSFSKIGFPSIKSGWIVTSAKLKKQLEITRDSYELDYFGCKSVEFLIKNEKYINELKKNLLSTKARWLKNLSKSKKVKVYDSKNYVLRIYSEDESLIKSIYDDLYSQKIVVGLVDKVNLVFSVVNEKSVENAVLEAVLRN